MKKLKFNLDDLKVKSFLTSIQASESDGIKGGKQELAHHTEAPHTCVLSRPPYCAESVTQCPPLTQPPICQASGNPDCNNTLVLGCG